MLLPVLLLTSLPLASSALASRVTPPPCKVELARQLSRNKCALGQTFGCDGTRYNATVWTVNCRGAFRCDGKAVTCSVDRPGRHSCPCHACPASGCSPGVNVSVAWGSPPLRTVSTAATVEVDIMPFLSRTAHNGGGSFSGYFEALRNLGNGYVRFAPWFPYWQVAVLELQEPDCRTGQHVSSWNSTMLDGVLADFMLAVCGPRAAEGECTGNRSVIPQLSTMPAWLYVNASNFSFIGDPWAYSRGFSEYEQTRRPLKDPSCRAMARYAARYVSWYTRGGMTDECGVWHESGLRYNWPILSVLNEDETQTPPEGGVEYTICFDAWREEIGKINADIVLMGPEATDGATWPGGDVLNYTLYFLNASNHADRTAPALVSNHHGDPASTGPPFSNFFTSCDTFIESVATPLDAARRAHAPHTELVMNEYVPVMNDWCELTSSQESQCPSWIQPPNGSQPAPSFGAKINRKTLGWNAAAASFAYAFGRFAQVGLYKLVGLTGAPLVVQTDSKWIRAGGVQAGGAGSACGGAFPG
jgi:hypothetical protein